MRTQNRSGFFLLLLTGLVAGCVGYDCRLVVVNKTKNNIYVEDGNYLAPDFPSRELTQYIVGNPLLPDNLRCISKPHKGSWPYFLQRESAGILHLFIFNVDTVAKLGHIDSSIVRGKFYRLDLPMDTLIKKNWTVEIKK